MSKHVTLEAEIRNEQGKEKVKKLRLKGLIPAVFYGKGIKNINLLVNAKAFGVALKKSEAKLNSLFNLKIKDQDKTSEEFVLVRQHQQNPVTDEFTHLDFMRVNTKEAIQTKVRVKLVGESPAIKQGLVLQQVMHELPIKCLPLDIPNFIEIDISKMENAHDAVRVGDLKSDKYTIELPEGQQIIHAEVPRELKVEEETTGPVSAEVPTTVQGAPAEEGKEGDAKAGAKPDAKAAPAKAEAKPEAKLEKK
jgi:large subunit ribosomal protein L25